MSVESGITLDLDSNDGPVKLTGSVSLTGTFTLAAQIHAFPAHATVDTSAKVGASAELSVSVSGEYKKKWELGEIKLAPIWIQAGLIPVIVRPEIPIYATFDAKASVSVSVGASFAIGGGFTWDSDHPDSLVTRNLSQRPVLADLPKPEPHATTTVSVGVEAAPDVLIEGVTGPAFDVTAQIQGSFDPFESPCFSLDIVLTPEVSWKFELFSWHGELTRTLGKFTYNLYETDACPAVTISPDPATVAAGSSVQLSAKDVDGNPINPTWQLLGGVAGDSISSSGLLTAAEPNNRNVTVVAHDSNDNLGTAVVQVQTEPFDPPGNLTASLDTNKTGATITWAAPAHTAAQTLAGYTISTLPATHTTNVTAPTTTVDIDGLDPDTTYTVRVVADTVDGLRSPPATATIGGRTLWAWGWNGGGELGDGTTTNRYSPTRIDTDSDWATVAAGRGHTVAVKTDGTLWAWGSNDHGQLGDGTTTNRYSPTRIGTDSDWATVAVGGNHTVAVKNDGTLWAWGLNSRRQLGDGTVVDKHSPTRIGTDSDWATVAANDTRTVALKTDGNLWTWGDTYDPSGVGFGWATVAAGYHFTVAVKTDGSLWAWGHNDHGNLGDGTTIARGLPTRIGTDSDWATVAAGYYFTVAVRTDGSLWAWGLNDVGELGDGTTTDRHSPTRIGTDSDWATVAAAPDYGFHSAALKSDGTLWAWGYNAWGRLGDGTTTDRHSPIRIGTDSDWGGASAGNDFTVAVKH